MEVPQERLAFSITELATAIGLSKPTLYVAINSGDLKTFRVGRRRLISREAALAYIRLLEAREPQV